MTILFILGFVFGWLLMDTIQHDKRHLHNIRTWINSHKGTK